jgi:hypothetical protein
VSSHRERSTHRICDQRLEHRVGDAPLEAPHSIPARLALPDFLVVVGSAARIATSLADGDHVQHLVEPAVSGERDPVPDDLAAGGFDGGNPGVGGA